ncbi:MAG: folylpolyglutamate synthase/dihydrofolate synthase family protein [Gemmataceae bacterium]
MTHDEALAYWFGRINYEQRVPRPGELRLDRMHALLQQLGQPQQRLRIVHIAGSKGKGSTAAMLAAFLRRAGYRTGLFTSPHLMRPEERVQVDGAAISSAELTALLTEIRELEALHFRSPESKPTFFELCTAIGFLHFARRRVDVAVVEVGLGGRFDATNVCRPLVSLITSISYDHTDMLGHTLADICMEKAGIVKPGVPVISGVTAAEARPVLERICRDRQAPLRRLDGEFRYEYQPGHVDAAEAKRPRVQVTTERRVWPIMEMGLLGRHQAANAAVAIATVEQLRRDGLRITDGDVSAGLAGVFWPARLEVLGKRPLVVLDCAHNVASAQALVDTLRSTFPPGRRLLIFAGSSDKDLAGMLRVLAPEFACAYVTRFRDSPRSTPPEELARLARAAGMPAEMCASASEAWQRARGQAGPDDLICITGSVFLAGELRREIG